jgi:predicted chitinase
MEVNDLKQYRKMALIRLEQLLVKQDDNFYPADYLVDKSIRILSHLPKLPDGARPYAGLYGSGKTLDQYRDVATDRLLELVEALPQLHEIDGEIDGCIRKLSDLPERSSAVEPYIDLFILREGKSDDVEIKTNPAPHTQQFVTTEQLLQIAGTNQFKDRIEKFTDGVNATLEKYNINNKLRIAHFLSQTMHESGGFRWLREIWGPTEAQKTYELPFKKAKELSNIQPGDGFKYRGRGLIQLTGRGNYQKFTHEVGKDFGVDFVEHPELLEQSPYAVLAAGWYWSSRNINAAADQDDFARVTKLVNGGTNGIEDRRKYLQRAKTVLQNSIVKTVVFPTNISNLYDFYKAKLEYGPDAIADNEKLATNIQEILIWLKFLDPPADGKFGPISLNALVEFQEIMSEKIPELAEEKGFLGHVTARVLVETSPNEVPKPELKLGNDLASQIIKYMQYKNYQIATNLGEYNIVYVEGMDTSGKLNKDQPNYFNDVRMVIEILNGKPKILGCWEATTEPGSYWTYHPMNPKGAARIAFGQYKAWKLGRHGNSEPHEALVQAANLTVCRDFNKDFSRTGDKLDTGSSFGINQHWGYDLPHNNVYNASAGCLVGRTRQGHREFMRIIKQDKRYQKNHNYLFLTTIIPGDDLEKQFASS